MAHDNISVRAEFPGDHNPDWEGMSPEEASEYGRANQDMPGWYEAGEQGQPEPATDLPQDSVLRGADTPTGLPYTRGMDEIVADIFAALQEAAEGGSWEGNMFTPFEGPASEGRTVQRDPSGPQYEADLQAARAAQTEQAGQRKRVASR